LSEINLYKRKFRKGNTSSRIQSALEIKDTRDTGWSASYLELHIENGKERNFTTKEVISIFSL
jgi:hypothetical protein